MSNRYDLSSRASGTGRSGVWRDTFRFSLSLQMVGMVVLLVLSCTLLVRVYAGTVRSLQQSQAKNESVLICRNIAEIYTAHPLLEALDETLWAEDAAAAGLTISLTEQVQGGMHSLTISSRTFDQEIYTLTVDVFVPEDADAAADTASAAGGN